MLIFGWEKVTELCFEAMGLCYADCEGPSTSLLDEDAAPHGCGTHGWRGRARNVMAGRGANTATLESRKRKCGWRGQGAAEPTDVRIGREMASKLGNNKKVVIEQTRLFGQVWTEMLVLPFALLAFAFLFWL